MTKTTDGLKPRSLRPFPIQTPPQKPRSSRAAFETKRRLEAIVLSAIDGIITINEARDIVLFNPGAERMFGLSAVKALGKPITDFIPELNRSAEAARVGRQDRLPANRAPWTDIDLRHNGLLPA